MIHPIPCKSSSLAGGGELGHGCSRQLKSKVVGTGEEGEVGRKDRWPTSLPHRPWGRAGGGRGFENLHLTEEDLPPMAVSSPCRLSLRFLFLQFPFLPPSL